MLKVLIIDDCSYFSAALQMMIDCAKKDLRVISTAASGAEGVSKAKLMAPDIILMDLNMPEMNGCEAIRLIRAQLPGATLIGMSLRFDHDEKERMLEAGADGLSLKGWRSENIIQAILQARSGMTQVIDLNAKPLPGDNPGKYKTRYKLS